MVRSGGRYARAASRTMRRGLGQLATRVKEDRLGAPARKAPRIPVGSTEVVGKGDQAPPRMAGVPFIMSA